MICLSVYILKTGLDKTFCKFGNQEIKSFMQGLIQLGCIVNVRGAS